MWSACADFYADTLDLACTFRNDDMRVATFDVPDGSYLVLEACAPSDEPEIDALPGRFTAICWQVADMDAAYADLIDRGVSFHEPPKTEPWGGILAHFIDPAGNTLTLVETPG